MRQVLAILFLLAAGGALADPPMKTVYQSTAGTKFVWQWPFHTLQTSTSTQIQPSPAGSGYRQIVASNTINGDLSQYRFHNAHLTYRNQWGYFFPAGTRPVKIGNGWSTFITPSK